MEQWYTLYTKPNAEYQVVTGLRQRAIQTYLPELAAPPSSCGQKRRPFFPGYMFIKADFEVMNPSSLQWIPGLRWIVACEGRPIPLADGIIELIQAKLSELEARGGWPGHSFKSGETVRITAGPFEDLLAIFDGPTTPAQRVRVLLNILGHANPVQVELAHLEKVLPTPAAPMPKQPRRTRGQGRWIHYE